GRRPLPPPDGAAERGPGGAHAGLAGHPHPGARGRARRIGAALGEDARALPERDLGRPEAARGAHARAHARRRAALPRRAAGVARSARAGRAAGRPGGDLPPARQVGRARHARSGRGRPPRRRAGPAARGARRAAGFARRLRLSPGLPVRDGVRARATVRRPRPRRARGRVSLATAPRAFWRLFACSLALALAAPPRPARAAQPRTLRIASKAFTESVVLAEIAAALERAAGVPVEHQVGLGGSRVLWDALANGAVDVYPEYTGTLLDEIFARDGTAPGAPARDRAWLIRQLAARGVAQISDLRAHPELRFGFSNEFMSRHDGWPALRRRYDLPQSGVQGLDHDLAYRALARGAADATDLYTTDPQIRRYGLLPLRDDLQFFQRYDAVFLYRLEIADRLGPAAVAALQRLSGRIDEATMTALNARAQLDRVPQAAVAAAFVRERFGIAAAPASATPGRALLRRVGEHLVLVGISLLAAILVALPLGILAAKQPRLGQAVLAAVGVVQTLPTLALLVFMIPLFGIGALPAIVALFVYGLLPIVRNTHAGLSGIPDSLRESAEALGLSPWARLRLIELPLASPLILAGIQSAAVINVGTATLGALIGAGGLGQPIFTGIRLDDMGLVLQGAIPASLLALAVQGLFELVERLLVPRGLRQHATTTERTSPTTR